MAGLVALNVAYFVLGLGLMPWLGLAPDGRALLARSGLGFMIGVAAIGIVNAELSLAGSWLDLPDIALAAVIAAGLGAYRLRRLSRAAREPLPRAGRIDLLLSLVPAAAAAALLVHAFGAFRVRPLLEWDGWATWGTKARALYELGGTHNAVFESSAYPHPDYPVFLPALEATAFRAIGSFDGTLVHLQLLALAAGFGLGLWGALARRVAATIIAIAVVALLSAPYLLDQLAWNYADVPLAFFVALGAVCLGRWVESGERAWLSTSVLFLAAGALTKNEGLMFAAAALVAAAIATAPPGRRRALELAAAAAVLAAIVLPWRLFVAAHHLRSEDFDLRNLARPGYLWSHSDRVRPASHELWTQMVGPRWGYLVAVFLLAGAAALLARSFREASFALLWFGLSFAGLVAIYWIQALPLSSHLTNSSYRTIAPLVIGGAALAPLLVAQAGLPTWRKRPAEPGPG